MFALPTSSKSAAICNVQKPHVFIANEGLRGLRAHSQKLLVKERALHSMRVRTALAKHADFAFFMENQILVIAKSKSIY